MRYANTGKNFVALDGETIDDKYVMLCTSEKHYTLENPNGITTDEALEFLTRLGSNRHLKAKGTIFVGFAFGYDVEMILRDLPDDVKDAIFNFQKVEYNGYRIHYIKRKFISIRKVLESGKATHGITIYDVWGFFQRSFEKTILQMLNLTSEVITQGKADRENFDFEHYNEIKDYCKYECALLVRVMDKLSLAVRACNLTPRRWYGASALAAIALKQWNIKDEMRRTVRINYPDCLFNALECAYFGGRIEAFKLGAFKDIYAYDINSAYPSAIAELYSNRGVWNYTREYNDNPFSVWNIRYKFPQDTYLGLFPFREANGAIKYPLAGAGWYWQPEVEYAMKRFPGCIKVTEGYYKPELIRTSMSENIPRMYEQRKRYKANGDLSEIALKLTLNSLYGKFAQKVGGCDYKNYTWAGMITSLTRAKLLKAIEGNEKHIIAFSTDGIYSNVPLDLPLSDKLGDWSSECYEKATVLMSGVYLLESFDKQRKTGERGFKRIDWKQFIAELNEKGTANVHARQFVTWNMFRNYRIQHAENYLTFVDSEKTFNPANLDKRHYQLDSIKSWLSDNCDSKPVKLCSGFSAPIKSETDEFEYNFNVFERFGV